MLEQLADRIWQSSEFHTQLARLSMAWLQRELGIERTTSVLDSDILKCTQAAVILATSKDPVRQKAAYSLAACAHDLRGADLPGTSGVLRVVLTRMGNFPAFRTSEAVQSFSRLPTRVAMSEETRRAKNQVETGAAPLVLTDFQRRLWAFLMEGASVAISAPTSAGKSFLLQAYLRELTRQDRLTTACYLVPSRALIAQVTDDISAWRLKDKRQGLAIINVPLTAQVALPDRAIYVLTQERAQAIMGEHPKFAPDVIICDEAQSIQEGARGVLLHNVLEGLHSRNPEAQLVFAGPNIGNLSAFAEIFGLPALEEVQSRSPSVVQNLVIVNTRSAIKGHLALEQFTPESRRDLGSANVERQLPTIKERLIRVAERFGQAKPSIVYANRPSDAEAIALGLWEVLEHLQPSERLSELAAFVKFAVHKEYDLARCLLRRVGYHYGRIPALVRNGVEAAFAEGEIKFLVTTSTLIQGVNFPAANLFICKPKKGQTNPLNAADFWNLAGRAGRLGKEFQGNIFLIDYDEWGTSPASQSEEVFIESYLKSTLTGNFDAVEACALESSPAFETEKLADVEATFARLLSDHMAGRLSDTLNRCGVGPERQARLTKALNVARSRIKLPIEVIGVSPTVSAIRQQRLAEYLQAEMTGGGIKRLEELIPRHPRDTEAFRSLSEIYRICHEQILTLRAPKLHVRMAAISLKWMRGEPLPEIIDENHRRSGGKIAKSILKTLNDIEQEIRFKYLRLTACYLAILAHLLRSNGRIEYLNSLSALPTYLEVGASDQTMISLMSLGLSRLTARLLTEHTMNKEMDPPTALKWLREQDIDRIVTSPLVLADIQRALTNNAV